MSFRRRGFTHTISQLKLELNSERSVIYLIPKGLIYPQNVKEDHGPFLRETTKYLNMGDGVIKIKLSNPGIVTKDDQAFVFGKIDAEFEKNLAIPIADRNESPIYAWKKIDLVKLLKAGNAKNYAQMGALDIVTEFESIDDVIRRAGRYGHSDVSDFNPTLIMFNILKMNPLYADVFGLIQPDPNTVAIRVKCMYAKASNKEGNVIRYVDVNSDEFKVLSGKQADKFKEELESIKDNPDEYDQLYINELKDEIEHEHKYALLEQEQKDQEVLKVTETVEIAEDEYLQYFNNRFNKNSLVVLANRFSKEISIHKASSILTMVGQGISRGCSYYKSKDQEVVAVIAAYRFLVMEVFTQDPDVLSGLFALPDDKLKLHFIEKKEDLREVTRTPGLGLVFFDHQIQPVCFQPQAKDFEDSIYEHLQLCFKDGVFY